MSDMSETIIPKSDQLNADSLLSGPITIKVTKVAVVMSEQPCTINYEGDAGRPYKPGKSMRRVLVKLWGADPKLYEGRSMTLYCDATVRFGGMEVGGIRISHMSDIDGPITMALTETKGKKKPFTVRPLVIAAPVTTPPRQTVKGFLDDLEADLAAALTPEAVDAIIARDDVQSAQDKLSGAAKDRLNAMVKAAIDRTAPVDSPPRSVNLRGPHTEGETT